MAAAAVTKTLTVSILPEILAKFPDAKVCFTLIEVIVKGVKESDKSAQKYLSEFKQKVVRNLFELGITPDNYGELRVCKTWRDVFATFEASPDKKSTIDTLIRRASGETAKLAVGKKADMGSISNFVDFYNCVSLETLTPMGALDLAKVDGDIELRFGRAGETFRGLGKDVVTEDVTLKHVIYADRSKVLTWLWNHRDAAAACVPKESPKLADGTQEPVYVLLFADQPEATGDTTAAPHLRPGDAEGAILKAMDEVRHIGGRALMMDCLTKTRPSVTLDLTHMKDGDIGVTPKV